MQSSYKMSQHDWITLQNNGQRPSKKKVKSSGRQPTKYSVSLSETAEPYVVFAFTKGEARAAIKKKLGLARLPVSTVIQE